MERQELSLPTDGIFVDESDADNMSRKVNDFMLKGCRLTLDSAK